MLFRSRRIERLLRRTATTVSLRIDEFPAMHLRSVERLLQRLSRYGDRISLHLDDELRRVLAVDLSPFHLVLDPARAQPAVAR